MKGALLFIPLMILLCFSCKKDIHSTDPGTKLDSYWQLDGTRYDVDHLEGKLVGFFRVYFGTIGDTAADKILFGSPMIFPTAPGVYPVRNARKYPLPVMADTGELYMSVYHKGYWYRNEAPSGLQTVQIFDSISRLFLRAHSLVFKALNSNDSVIVSSTLPMFDSFDFSPVKGSIAINNAPAHEIVFLEWMSSFLHRYDWESGTNKMSLFHFNDLTDTNSLPLYDSPPGDLASCAVLQINTDKTPANFTRFTFIDTVLVPPRGDRYLDMKDKRIVYEVKNATGIFVPIDTQVFNAHIFTANPH